MKFGFDGTEYKKECDICGGAWVLVKCRIPVDEKIRPQTYGIYWAIPHKDKYNRQMVKIYTPQEVCLLNYEYTVIPETRLEEYKTMGYYLKEINVNTKQPLNLEILDKGRALCEEEREIIWALQLDGLTEQQACEEYFYTHHIDTQNSNICYLPNEETLKAIVSYFGENGIRG